MAGHSQFKNIMHRKGAQDARRARQFNKIAREITVACKNGSSDPASNPRLRAAITNARGINMPRERIERAIAAAQAGAAGSTNYDEVRYEGYGPGGIALIVEALTDNRQRTAPEVRTAFSKYGGALGETGSVSFMFTRCGAIRYASAAATADAMLEAAIEAGADDAVADEEGHVVTSSVESFAAVRDALETKFGPPAEARLEWRPQATLPITGDAAQQLLKLIEVLEENDDVQSITGNFEWSGEV